MSNSLDGTLEVPLLDLQAQYRAIRTELHEVLTETLDSTRYALGPHVTAFEQAFSAYVGSAHCIGVNSGTSALHLALIAAGVGPGDEVITVPMTFIATTWAVTYVGAKPVFVDVSPTTYTMDVDQVEAAITARTTAILPVHLYGQPADLAPLVELGYRHGIPLIEDAAQAHGARYQGASVGSRGLLGCFSFYPSKNLGALGEAGAVVTDDDELAARLRALRDHAQPTRNRHDELGFNYRMDAIQGAALEVKLRYLDRWIIDRRSHAKKYTEALAGSPLRLPIEAADRRHSWHLYVILHPDRDRVQVSLAEAGVSTGLHYPVPVHLQGAYEHLGHRPGEFPVSERIADECLSLPMFPELTEHQIDHVCHTLADTFTGVGPRG